MTDILQATILRCTCIHLFQDKQYGKGMRLHNPCLKPQPGYRCTVCGAHQSHGQSVAPLTPKETKKG